MLNLTDRINNQIEVQLRTVENIISRIEKEKLTIEQAIEEIDRKIKDMTLIKRALGESEEEQAITNKIIRTMMAMDYIKKGEISPAKYALKNL